MANWFGDQSIAAKYAIILGCLLATAILLGLVKVALNRRKLKKHTDALEAQIAAKEGQTDEEKILPRELGEGDLFGIKAIRSGFYGGVAQSAQVSRSGTPISSRRGSLGSKSITGVSSTQLTQKLNELSPQNSIPLPPEGGFARSSTHSPALRALKSPLSKSSLPDENTDYFGGPTAPPSAVIREQSRSPNPLTPRYDDSANPLMRSNPSQGSYRESLGQRSRSSSYETVDYSIEPHNASQEIKQMPAPNTDPLDIRLSKLQDQRSLSPAKQILKPRHSPINNAFASAASSTFSSHSPSSSRSSPPTSPAHKPMTLPSTKYEPNKSVSLNQTQTEVKLMNRNSSFSQPRPPSSRMSMATTTSEVPDLPDFTKSNAFVRLPAHNSSTPLPPQPATSRQRAPSSSRKDLDDHSRSRSRSDASFKARDGSRVTQDQLSDLYESYWSGNQQVGQQRMYEMHSLSQQQAYKSTR